MSFLPCFDAAYRSCRRLCRLTLVSLQVATWGLLVPTGVFAMRFMKHKPAHMVFHK